MSNTASNPVDRQLISLRFNDIDALNETLAAWDTDFRQLDLGSLSADLLQVGGNGLLLSQARFDRRIDQQGAAPAGAFTFAVPRNESSSIVWRSQRVPRGSMIVYRPGSEIDGASQPGFSVLTLSVSAQLFEGACLRAGRRDLLEIAHKLELVTPNPVALHRFVVGMEQVARSGVAARDSAAQARLLGVRLDALTGLVIEALASSRPTLSTPTSSRRSLAIRRAIEHLQEHENECVTVASLCKAAEVSERTLQYAFVERFDVTPKRYVQAHRMHAVRRRLKSLASTVCVSDIANHFGFWHMGQFAGDYRRQFGELPSETVRRLSAPNQ